MAATPGFYDELNTGIVGLPLVGQVGGPAARPPEPVPAPAPPPTMTMAPTPVINKAPDAAPPPPMPRAPGIDPNVQGAPNSVDTSVQLDQPPIEVLGYTPGTAAKEGDSRTATQRKLDDGIRDRSLSANAENAGAAHADADRELQFHQQQADQYEMDAFRLEDQKYKRQQEQMAMEADVTKAIEEYANQKQVDTGDKRDFWARLTDAFAAGLLGFAGDSAGIKAINDRSAAAIEQSIQAQKDQIAAKQIGLKGKQTALENARLRFGDDNVADEVVRASLYKKRAAEFDALATKSKDVKQQEAYRNVAVDNMNTADTIQRNAMKMMGGSPAMVRYSMGGQMVTGTMKQYNQDAREHGKANVAAQRSTASSVAIEQAKGKASGHDDVSKQATEFGKEVAKDAPALSTLQQVEDALVASSLSGKERAMRVTGISNPLVNKWVNGSDAVAREQAWGQVKAQVISDISGSGVSDSERKNLTDMVEGAGDTASRMRAVQFSRNKIMARQQALRQAYDPRATQLYDSRAPKANASGLQSEE